MRLYVISSVHLFFASLKVLIIKMKINIKVSGFCAEHFTALFFLSFVLFFYAKMYKIIYNLIIYYCELHDQ